MKTWEMIKELMENSKKKFKSIPSKDHESYVYVTIKHGKVFFENILDESTALYYIDLDWGWEEVKQAVSFIEAVESGERLMVEHDLLSGEGTEYFKNFNSLDGLMYEICAVFGADEVRQIIVKGKWYIG